MKTIFKYIILFKLLFIYLPTVAQDGGEEEAVDCESGTDINPNCEENAPIDSGVGLLVGAIAFYSVKKLREKNNPE